MRPLATVMPLGPRAREVAASLDHVQLACDVADDFASLKLRTAGTLAVLLLDDADDASLAAAQKAARILRVRGSEQALLVLPGAEPRIERVARLTKTFAIQPVGISQAAAVRCWLEPLAIFGLVGVDRREVLALAKPGGHAMVCKLSESTPPAPDAVSALVTCRLRPESGLREVEEAAQLAHRLARGAHLVITGRDVSDDGPRALVSFNF